MRQTLAYEAQVKRLGGHSAAVKRALKTIVHDSSAAGITDPNGARNSSDDLDVFQGSKTSAPTLRPGTHLVREWNGRTYQVEVLEKGFQMDGKVYRSLSAAARKITGAHWSGPRFFGLVGQ